MEDTSFVFKAASYDTTYFIKSKISLTTQGQTCLGKHKRYVVHVNQKGILRSSALIYVSVDSRKLHAQQKNYSTKYARKYKTERRFLKLVHFTR